MKTHSWPDEHWHWPVKLSHYHGVRRGGLIFTGGQADLDLKGEVVNPFDLTQQTNNVLKHIESILIDLEASLDDVVKLVIYFTGDAADESLILDLIAARLSERTRPVVSTICLPALCYPGMRVEVEAIAIDPTQRSSANPLFIRSNELHNLPDQFSHAVRCNGLVFTGDVSAVDSNEALESSGELIAQTHLMMRNLERLLTQANVSRKNILKLNVFYLGDGTAQNWSAPAAIRAAFFSDPGPAATGIAVTGFAQPGLMTKIAVTAVAPLEDADNMLPPIQYSWPNGHWNWTNPLPYKHGNRCGKIIHLGGQVSLDVNAQVLHPGDIVEQTRLALKNVQTILHDLNASMDDIVKVTTFYQGNASAEALHTNLRIRSDAFKAPGPATTGIPVPHLVYENMLIEIEVIAIAR